MLKLKCTLCDKITEISDESLQAKKYRNHPLLLFICSPCDDVIKEKASVRLQQRQT